MTPFCYNGILSNIYRMENDNLEEMENDELDDVDELEDVRGEMIGLIKGCEQFVTGNLREINAKIRGLNEKVKTREGQEERKEEEREKEKRELFEGLDNVERSMSRLNDDMCQRMKELHGGFVERARAETERRNKEREAETERRNKAREAETERRNKEREDDRNDMQKMWVAIGLLQTEKQSTLTQVSQALKSAAQQVAMGELGDFAFGMV
jgi:hypothetical protein